MKVDAQLIRELNALISQRGIDVLVLTTPQASLRLERDARAYPASRTSPSPARKSANRSPATHAVVESASSYELTAPAPGIYLDRHPLGTRPLVTPGTSIEAGTLIGFLQVGCLLLPLRSAQAGRIVSLPQRAGDTLGYGTVVMVARLAAAGRS